MDNLPVIYEYITCAKIDTSLICQSNVYDGSLHADAWKTTGLLSSSLRNQLTHVFDIHWMTLAFMDVAAIWHSDLSTSLQHVQHCRSTVALSYSRHYSNKMSANPSPTPTPGIYAPWGYVFLDTQRQVYSTWIFQLMQAVVLFVPPRTTCD
jgi:hypothetical protein